MKNSFTRQSLVDDAFVVNNDTDNNNNIQDSTAFDTATMRTSVASTDYSSRDTNQKRYQRMQTLSNVGAEFVRAIRIQMGYGLSTITVQHFMNTNYSIQN